MFRKKRMHIPNKQCKCHEYKQSTPVNRNDMNFVSPSITGSANVGDSCSTVGWPHQWSKNYSRIVLFLSLMRTGAALRGRPHKRRIFTFAHVDKKKHTLKRRSFGYIRPPTFVVVVNCTSSLRASACFHFHSVPRRTRLESVVVYRRTSVCRPLFVPSLGSVQWFIDDPSSV